MPVVDGGILLTIPKDVNALIEPGDSFPCCLEDSNIRGSVVFVSYDITRGRFSSFFFVHFQPRAIALLNKDN